MAINHVLQTAGDIYFTVNVTSVTISAPTSTDNETGLGVSHNRYGRLKAHDTVSGLESDWSNTVLVNTGIAPYSNFFADYDFNKPIYRTYTGHSVTVKDASNVSHDIGFTSGGLIDKAACDALTGPLKVQTLYDKSGNSRDVSLVGGGGDWYLLFRRAGHPVHGGPDRQCSAADCRECHGHAAKDLLRRVDKRGSGPRLSRGFWRE
jgi:hypothetical protein